MEDVMQAIGVIGMVILAIIGLLAGWIAALVAGGRRGTYMAIGLVAALATPFVLAVVGLGVLAASGLVAILIAAAIGAVIVLLIARMILD